MSFSQGMLAGYRVGMGLEEFEAQQKQQELDNAFRDRIIDINEGVESRRAQQFAFGNDEEMLTRFYADMQGDTKTEFSLEQYASDVEQGGTVEALRRTLTNQFGGDFSKMLADPNGQQVALHQLNQSPAFRNRIEDGTNVHADGLVPLRHPETGQRGFAIRTVNPQGQVGGVSRNRAVGEQDLVFIPEENLALMMFEGLREQGAFNSPQAIQQFEEMGFDYEASMAAIEGQSPLDTIPKATKLEGVVKGRIKPSVVDKKQKLNDGTESRKASTADPLSNPIQLPEEESGGVEDLARFYTENFDELTSDDRAFMRQRIADHKESLGTVEAATIAAEEIGRNIPEKGLIPATADYISQHTEPVREFVSDTVQKTIDSFSKAGTFLFGPDVALQSEEEGAKPSEEVRKTDREIVQGMGSNDPAKRADAEARIEEQISTSTPVQRVRVGAADIAAFYNRNGRQSSKPTPRQMAQATRMLTNGLINQNALATFLETGKFTLEDLRIAAAENSARTRAVKNQIDYRKMLQEIGKERADQLKSDFDVNLNAASTAFAQHFSHNSGASRILEKSGVNAPEFSESVLNGIYTHPRIIAAFTRGQGKYAYQLSGEDMSRIARYTAEILNQNMVKGEDNWFSRDVEQQLPFTDQLVTDIIAGLARDETQLQN